MFSDELMLNTNTKMFEAAEYTAHYANTNKQSYIIEYDPNEKKLLFSIIEKMSCFAKSVINSANRIEIDLSKEQLRVIKMLDCILRVETVEPYKSLDFRSGMLQKEK